MKKDLLFFSLALFCLNSFAQIKYQTFESRKLNQVRNLKIKLPKNYDPSSELKHPVIIVFDGDYLFEPVVGQAQYQTYFDEMPESIIVGIVQGRERFYDSYYDEVTGLPIEFGAKFYEFISMELLPYLDENYNTSKFRVAVGHDVMGNFMNSFLLKDKPLFQAYINLSPDFKGTMGQNIGKRLALLKDELFYYMATSDNDIQSIRQTIHQANSDLKQVDNNRLTYYFEEFQGDSHYTLVTGALSKALDRIFEIYKPLDEKELTEKALPYEGTLDDYITQRYDRIEELFGIHKPITEEEFVKIVEIAERREDLESIMKIGKLANKLDPSSSFGTYYMALYQDRVEKPKKAVKLYETALNLKESNYIDKEYIKERVEELKFVMEEVDEDVEELEEVED